MNLFAALVAITAIIGFVLISRHWLESRRSRSACQARLDQIEDEFRKRIETLERIVTDRREALRKQIDEL